MRIGALLPLGALLIALPLGCSDPAGPAGSGTVTVRVTTAGGDPDLDGYHLLVDGQPVGALAPVETRTITLPAGRHVLQLDGVAANCASAGQAVQEISLPDGAARDIFFSVNCRTTGVLVTVTTSGPDGPAAGYAAELDGTDEGRLPANGSRALSRITGGAHALTLRDVPENCVVAGGSMQTVEVVIGEVIPVAFAVTCTSATGVLRVRVQTSGQDLDDRYDATVLGTGLTVDVVNGLGQFPRVPGGALEVQLGDLARNCQAVGTDRRSVEIATGLDHRDTVEVAFEVSCALDRGTIGMHAVTTGVNLDDAFVLEVRPEGSSDSAAVQTAALPANGTARLELRSGSWEVALRNVANNCSVQSPSLTDAMELPAPVEIAPGEDVLLDLAVSCAGPGRITIRLAVSGPAPAEGLRVAFWDIWDWWFDFPPMVLGPVPDGGLTIERGGGFWVVSLIEGMNCRQVVPPDGEDGVVVDLPWGGAVEVTIPVNCTGG